MKKRLPCHIRIRSEQSDYTEIARAGLENRDADASSDADAGKEKTDLYTEGTLEVSDGGNICVSYEESDLTGMEGTLTSLAFDSRNPGLVTLMRSGTYQMAMVFEKGRRHICTYETPYMPIELCIVTKKLRNSIGVGGGTLYAEYAIETNGMRSEQTLLHISVKPDRTEGNAE